METAWAGHCKLKDNGHEVHKHNGIVLIDRKKWNILENKWIF